MKKLVLALSLCATSILTAQQTQKTEALDSVMITTKINIPKKNSGKVVTTITRAQLNNSQGQSVAQVLNQIAGFEINRKSTRLNSSHDQISYAVFCLKKKKRHSL